MYKRAGIALIISGLTMLGVYRYRRSLISRLLGLPPALHEVAVERGLRITMPDSVELVADRYRPRQPGRFPTILVRTPYSRKASGFFASQRMAERGYNVLVQDVRGSFDSEGDFDVFAGEADASHRGGNPGFVRFRGEIALELSDYSGNTMFNTLGNIAANPSARLLFLDFEGGGTLQLTGEAQIVRNAGRAARFAEAERVLEFQVQEARRTADELPRRKAGRHRKEGRLWRRRSAGRD